MSKIAFTVSVPHEGPHVPQFSVSCQNATFLSFKGKDIGKARFGNGNLTPKKGWKRLEFGVTGSSAATRFSVLLNTSVVLPPVAWSTPGPAPAASAARGGSLPTKKDVKEGAKKMKYAVEGKQPLRIESGRSRDDRSRRYDEGEDDTRSRRGERVRRSDRRRQHESRRGSDDYQSRVDDDDYRSSHRSEHHDRSQYRDHGRHRRNNASEDEWEDDAYDKGRREGSTKDEEDNTNQRRVTGKKINPRYRKPSHNESSLDWREDESPERSYYKPAPSKSSRRHHVEADRLHRRRGRRDPFAAANYGYGPEANDAYDAGFDFDGGVAD